MSAIRTAPRRTVTVGKDISDAVSVGPLRHRGWRHGQVRCGPHATDGVQSGLPCDGPAVGTQGVLTGLRRCAGVGPGLMWSGAVRRGRLRAARPSLVLALRA